MIDFSLTTDQSDLVSIASKFVKNEIPATAEKCDKEFRFPIEIYQKIFEQGFINPRIPSDYGGAGLGVIDECLLMEEFGSACCGIATTMIATSTALDAIIANGTDEQKKTHLIPFTENLHFASFCVTEPDFGSDIASISTTAKKDGNQYIITGRKRFVSNAPYSNLFIVFATTDPVKGKNGISAFIVPKNAEGIKIGPELGRMGNRTSSSADVEFSDVRVPSENILGKEGDGMKIAYGSLNKARVLIASASVGLARTAMNHALNYALKRIQFNQPIAYFEATEIKFANMAQDISASRLLTWYAASRLDRGEDAAKESAMAKCFASDMAMKTAVEAVQIFGGYGYTKDYPVEKLMRDAKLLQIFGGVNEMLKLGTARKILKSIS